MTKSTRKQSVDRNAVSDDDNTISYAPREIAFQKLIDARKTLSECDYEDVDAFSKAMKAVEKAFDAVAIAHITVRTNVCEEFFRMFYKF